MVLRRNTHYLDDKLPASNVRNEWKADINYGPEPR